MACITDLSINYGVSAQHLVSNLSPSIPNLACILFSLYLLDSGEDLDVVVVVPSLVGLGSGAAHPATSYIEGTAHAILKLN